MKKKEKLSFDKIGELFVDRNLFIGTKPGMHDIAVDYMGAGLVNVYAARTLSDDARFLLIPLSIKDRGSPENILRFVREKT